MLLLVTIGLVLVAAATLVIGLVSNSLTPIYISIVCSAVAAIVLFLFYRMNRGRRAATTGLSGGPLVDTTPPVFAPSGSATAPRRPSGRVLTGVSATPPSFADSGDGADQGAGIAPPPAAPEWPTRRFGRSPATPAPSAAPSWPPATPPTSRPGRPRAAPTPAPAPAAAASPAASEPPAPAAAGTRPFRRPEPLGVPETPEPGAGPTLASMSSRPAPASPAAEAEAETGSWSDPLPFPIEDYDELRVVEIISVLPELDDDELDEVRQYEQGHRGRAAIVSRIETLLAGPGEPEAEGTDEAEAAPPTRRGAGARAGGAGGPAGGGADDLGAEGEGAEAEGAEAEGAEGAEGLPIADYDFLGVSEILPLLSELDPDELEDMRGYEAGARGRATILFRIDALLASAGRPEPAPEAEAAPEPEPAAAEPESEPVAAAEPQYQPEPEPEPERERAGEFPIAGYDRLRVFQILSLLPELDDDELEAVRDHEEAHRNRVTILNQINSQLSDAAPPAPATSPAAAPPAEPEPEAEAPAAPEPEPEPEPEPVGAADAGAADLPIAEYDDLGQWEILPLLDELYDDELEQVRDYEDAHRARVAILRRIDALFETPVEEPDPGGAAATAGEEPQEAAAREWEEPEALGAPEAAGEAEPSEGGAGEAEPGEEVGSLPIADYDSLSAFAVLPLLDQLSPDELDQIRDYEDANRARVTILYRIDKLLASPGPEAAAGEDEAGPAASTAEQAASGEDGAPAAEHAPEEAAAVEHPAEEEPAAEEKGAAGGEGAADEEGAAEAQPAEGDGGIDIADLPIAEYDQLMVSEILPLLAELYDDELELVRDFEDANLARVAILARIDALLEEPYEDEAEEQPEPVGEDAGEVEPEATAPAEHREEAPGHAGEAGGGVAASKGAAAGGDEEAFEEDEEFEDEEPPAAAGDGSFPIADYDELRVAEILPLLSQLQPDELEQVARHEQETANRSAILNRIERLLRLSPAD